MKKALNSLILLSVVALLAGCSTKVVRTQENDSMMRVLIDPRIEVAHYVQIRRALVQTGKFEVIDRRDGFEAAVQEQDLQFRSGYKDRFSDREKWAHIGRMYGARGIITAYASCYQKNSWTGEFRKYCKQELAFIDSYTGRVEFAVRGENSEPWVVGYSVPDWDDVVERAADEYPQYFKARKIDPLLEQYMNQSEELAKRDAAKQAPKAAVAPSIANSVRALPASIQQDPEALGRYLAPKPYDPSADLDMMSRAAQQMRQDEVANGQ